MRAIQSQRATAMAITAAAISIYIVLTCGLAALAILGAARARAQEIEPNEFIPLPAGTNLLLNYYCLPSLTVSRMFESMAP